MLLAASARRSAGRPRPAGHDEQHDVADPPERHRGLLSATIAALRAMPGSAPRMTSNCALIALTARLERAQVLGLDALERAAERREALGDRGQAPADQDQRDGEHGDHDDARAGR